MRPFALAVPLLLLLATQASADDPATRRLTEDWETGDDGWYVYSAQGSIMCGQTTHGCIYALGGSLSTTTEVTGSALPPYTVGSYQLEASFIPPRGGNSVVGLMIDSDVDEQLQLIVHPTGAWQLRVSWITSGIVLAQGESISSVTPRDGWLTMRLATDGVTGEITGTLLSDSGAVLKEVKSTAVRPPGLARKVVIVGAFGPTGTPTFVDDVKLDLTL